MHCVQLHKSIIAIDIERSTDPRRTNPIRAELWHEAHRLLVPPCGPPASPRSTATR
jgi:hypothetical protein